MARTVLLGKRYECRIVEVEDTILPDDHNCKVDVLERVRDCLARVAEVLAWAGWPA